ncbi:ferredoxin-type protein NapF [Grimontia hollisae]|uniref:Ferredoxin-type protein NapF n=1 Tax=Grimontia hollisae CIP 101886 TaxID=675812 RepID=D0IAV9_GRIHO|nr:ferredoxin-type protein NapF [Grimontia hollisae]AMG31977.1 ferredoxin-type protein NapF [Grimontia hollisae]EEY71027.1 nitrate reductase [Grimontia hollisae CIP 101886]STO44302.1 ferredoxin-type protein [Grimontia hollisae]
MVDTRRRFFLRSKAKTRVNPLPWIADWESFTDQCTRCGDCIRECEANVIVSGDGGFPTIDFGRGECTFCYACAEKCPEPLFKDESAKPWDLIATINDQCLTRNGVECRSCSDACETRAIKFQLTLGQVAQPTLNLQDCTGCGACIAPCPANAIAMENISNE